ncbi:MAG: tetratricopeptide repeat protein [Planctomycetota bacterium]
MGPLLLPCLAQDPVGHVPELHLSLPGIARGVVEAGEPVRVVVRLTAPRSSAQRLLLAPAQGTWAENIVVELTAAAGGPPLATARPVGGPGSPTATLDADRVAGGLWRFPAGAMQAVPPGELRVRARLAIAAGQGWTGQADSDPVELRVVEAGAKTADPVQRAVNLAWDALIDGRAEAAATVVDEALQEFADNQRLLLTRCEVCLQAGNWQAAAVCLRRLRQVAPSSAAAPPSWHELATRIEVVRGTPQPSTEPPAWSWPRAVMDAYLERVRIDATRAAAGPARAADTSGPEQPPAPTPVPTTSATGATPKPAPAEPPNGVLVAQAELEEAKILATAGGSWASSAAAASQYSSPNYGAGKLTGAPDVPQPGDHPNAWCPGSQSNTAEWIELSYATAMHATEVRVRQTSAPGAIVKVEASEPDGTTHVWWQGSDPVKTPSPNTIAWFAVRVPKTSYLVARIRITLDLSSVPGWKEIDAVQLVGTAP